MPFDPTNPYAPQAQPPATSQGLQDPNHLMQFLSPAALERLKAATGGSEKEKQLEEQAAQLAALRNRPAPTYSHSPLAAGLGAAGHVLESYLQGKQASDIQAQRDALLGTRSDALNDQIQALFDFEQAQRAQQEDMGGMGGMQDGLGDMGAGEDGIPNALRKPTQPSQAGFQPFSFGG